MVESVAMFLVVLALVLALSMGLNKCGGFEFVTHPFAEEPTDERKRGW